ncbi:choline dehydrogenase [Pseudonocardia zijingensis]|uniref:Choline dehydrogenase n=1 Tax=Pseudonocardia zijingensis TaxID=153376 RepID=A0ABN1N8B7_9PSEU
MIVGGGPAGCILANRLSADPSARVILLEAGGTDHWWDLRIQLPLAMGFPVGHRSFDWRYESEPEPNLGSRRLHHPRGKVLGGSSSINGMLYERGHRGSYDRWAEEAGSPEWDYDHCEPYFRRLEGCVGEPRGTGRGRSGPQSLQRGPAEGPIFDAFFEAAQQAGYKVVPDVNDDAQEGFSPLDQAVRGGKRASAAAAYLHPVESRPNLEIRTHATVSKVLFEGTRAVGVRYRDKDGETHDVRAAETILSAGAIGTPQILQLSGVGDGEHLRSLGIPVVHHLPGVGESLQEHLAVHVQHKCIQPVSMSDIRNKAKWPGVVLDALVFGKGPGTRNPMQAGGFVRSDFAEGDEPDLMFLLAPLAMNSSEESVEVTAHGYQMHVGVMRSEARGSVKIASPIPAVHPKILVNFLSDPKDRPRWINALQRARHLLGQPAFRDLDGGETLPGPGVRSDEEIMAWVRRTGRVGYHPACTAAMGRGEMSVVDPDTMRVHGVDGLRVVDASVMPSLTNANTLAPTMMIAEKSADIILGNARLLPRRPQRPRLVAPPEEPLVASQAAPRSASQSALQPTPLPSGAALFAEK